VDAVTAELKAQVERQLAHPFLRSLVGVLERPFDRPLAELAVVRGDVCAAAVVEVARDGAVVVAVDRRDLPFGDQRDDFVGVRPVADEVASAEHALDAELVDAGEGGFERREVAMDVGDDSDPIEAVLPLVDARGGHGQFRMVARPLTATLMSAVASLTASSRRSSVSARRGLDRGRPGVEGRGPGACGREAQDLRSSVA
jgi:hypothetical protein